MVEFEIGFAYRSAIQTYSRASSRLGWPCEGWAMVSDKLRMLCLTSPTGSPAYHLKCIFLSRASGRRHKVVFHVDSTCIVIWRGSCSQIRERRRTRTPSLVHRVRRLSDNYLRSQIWHTCGRSVEDSSESVYITKLISRPSEVVDRISGSVLPLADRPDAHVS